VAVALAGALAAGADGPSRAAPAVPGQPADLLAREGPSAIRVPAPGSLLVDLRHPEAQAAFTLDGFRRARGETAATGDDGAGGLHLPDGRGAVILPVEAPGDAWLQLGVRLPTGRRVRVRVDGRDLGAHPPTVASATDGAADGPPGGSSGAAGVVTLRLPGETFGPGDHHLSLAADQGALEVRYLRVDPAPPGGALPPPAPTADAPSPEDGGWRLSAGWGLRLPLWVAPGSRMTIEARPSAEARLEVRLLRDSVPRGPATAALGGGGTGRVVLDLGHLEGDLVTAELRAVGGDAWLQRVDAIAPPEVPPNRRGGLRKDNASETDTARSPRHLVVVLVDTLRADHLGAYGSDVPTPVLDAFAEEAAVFREARSPTSWTKPSVATLLTGRHPWQHRATTHRAMLPATERLLSERLADAGFRTAAFVTNAYISADYGFERGFHHFDHAKTLPPDERPGGSRAPAVIRRVDRWLAGDGRPGPEDRLFLYVHLTDPHSPYRPPAALLAERDPLPYAGPVDFEARPKVLEAVRDGELSLDLRDRERLRALYAAEVMSLDAALEALFTSLDRHGVADDAAILFTSDHGEELLEHGSVLHGHALHEELIRIPFMLRAPGMKGLRLSEPVGLVDVVPTALSLLGLPAERALPGMDLLPVLRGALPPASRLPPVSARRSQARALVVGRFKLVERAAQSPYASLPFLYDLARSPDEKEEISLERPHLLRALRGWLGRALAPTGGGDPGNPRPEALAGELDPTTEAQLRALGYL